MSGQYCGCADGRYIESSQIHVRSLFLSSQPSLDLESESYLSALSLQGFPYVSHPSNHLRHSFAYVRASCPKKSFRYSNVSMSSNGSKTPSTGFTVSSRMERVDIMTTRVQAHHAPPFADTPDFLEHELIPTKSRLSRLPTPVPLEPHHIASPPASAIPAQNSPLNTSSGQDVHFVNASASSTRSPAISTIGPKTPLETVVSSFSSPLTQNDLKHPIRRPRTSTQVFQSSTDLAAHYGIPQRLPPVPSTSRQHPLSPFSTDLPDFATLSQNYINMLSNKDTDPVATYSMSTMHTPVLPTELNAPVVSPTETDTLDELAALIGMGTASNIPLILTHLRTATVSSPEFRQYSDFMTSPMMPDLAHDVGISPEETPFEDFLNTPLIDDDDFDCPMGSLFPDFVDPTKVEEPTLKPQYPTHLVDAPYTISPTSPSIDTFDTFHQPATTPSRHESSPKRRVSKATGIRKGITVDALLDESAPTQARKYVTPSATSKKEIPATFARKRARSVAFGDEEDELGDDIPLNENEKNLIEQKRLKNTLAARKSRRRKLEQYQNMEKSRDEEREHKQVWKERALVLLQTLREQGVPYPDFPEDNLQFEHV